MHCWKTINVKKQYGFERLFMISALFAFGIFLTSFIVLNIVYTAPLSDDYFLPFVGAILAIYPLHKACHFLPLTGCRDCLRFIIQKRLGLVPRISLHIKEPVPKMLFILTLVAPFLLINSALIFLIALMPAFSHYFAMLLAYHCGLCLTDLIYMRNLARSPKHALIEETETGFEILVPQVMA